MPTLTECMKYIRKLVKEKGHEDELKDVTTKWLFSVVEISEAVDRWKKWGWSSEYNVRKICEEIIDAVFYLLDAYGIIKREYPNVEDPDKMFKRKLAKNFTREYRYGRPKDTVQCQINISSSPRIRFKESSSYVVVEDD